MEREIKDLNESFIERTRGFQTYGVNLDHKTRRKEKETKRERGGGGRERGREEVYDYRGEIVGHLTSSPVTLTVRLLFSLLYGQSLYFYV